MCRHDFCRNVESKHLSKFVYTCKYMHKCIAKGICVQHRHGFQNDGSKRTSVTFCYPVLVAADQFVTIDMTSLSTSASSRRSKYLVNNILSSRILSEGIRFINLKIHCVKTNFPLIGHFIHKTTLCNDSDRLLLIGCI